MNKQIIRQRQNKTARVMTRRGVRTCGFQKMANFYFQGQRQRLRNACDYHKRRHQRCPEDCERRKSS